jgi:hypothetical protein
MTQHKVKKLKKFKCIIFIKGTLIIAWLRKTHLAILKSLKWKFGCFEKLRGIFIIKWFTIIDFVKLRESWIIINVIKLGNILKKLRIRNYFSNILKFKVNKKIMSKL